MIDDRAELKREINETSDAAEVERLQGRADALKWILVTCFGYQGHSNSKFGRIEVHEAINAWGREILLDAKMALSGTASGRDGFLSGRSMEYLNDILRGEMS